METVENLGHITGYPMMLTVKEVGEILRTGRNTTYDLISSGEIPSIKIGRQIRIYSKNLLLYLEKKASEK
jgi:excisionase family DNA binding protein